MTDTAPSIASSSIQSRIEIWEERGLEQLSVNPIFGDLAADIVTGSPGYYLHSIFSVQTHLGVIGSILFFPAFAGLVWSVYAQGTSRTLKSITLPLVVVAVLAAFWTWMPLWFLIGAMWGQVFNLPNDQKGLETGPHDANAGHRSP